jgi:hypothetical protein
LEDIRIALRSQGVEQATITTLLQAWEPATVKNYDVFWRGWSKFAQLQGKDQLAVDEPLLQSWMERLINDKANSEGTTEKAKTVVRSTWELIHDAAARTDKLTKAAAKINQPKRKAKGAMWDISYLHEYLHAGEPIDDGEDLKLMTLVEKTVLKLRGQAGWRSGDLCGLLDCGLTFLDTPGPGAAAHGVSVRLFDTKMYKKAWAPPVFFPRLADKYSQLCVYRTLKKLHDVVKNITVDTISVPSPIESSTQVQARPLMVYAPSKAGVKRGEKLHKPLAENTVAAYFKKAFLANVAGAGGKNFDQLYKPHSARHAVASRLALMGVPAAKISTLTLNSAETLEKTYILAVDLEWPVPEACVAGQALLPAKILLPYVHYTSTKGKSGAACDCANILQQVPPS